MSNDCKNAPFAVEANGGLQQTEWPLLDGDTDGCEAHRNVQTGHFCPICLREQVYREGYAEGRASAIAVAYDLQTQLDRCYRTDGPVRVGDVFDAGWGGRTWRILSIHDDGYDPRARVSVELDGKQEVVSSVSLKVGLANAPRLLSTPDGTRPRIEAIPPPEPPRRPER